MAQKNPRRRRTPLRPLPVRIARLHARLFIAVAGRPGGHCDLLPADWRLSTRLLAGWNVGIALYLVLIHS